MWLLQVSSAGPDFDRSTLIWVFVVVVTPLFTTLGGLLLKGWQAERAKEAARLRETEAEERKRTDQLLALREAEVEFWRTHALELEATKSKNLETILAAINNIRSKGATEPPRNDSPPPGAIKLPDTTYSQTSRTSPTKTRR